MPEPRLLDTYLKQLRLPTFLQNYRKLAEDASRADLTYERYLLKLAEQEIAQREANQQARRIRAARFPVLKELADFDFSALPNLKKAQVLDLAQGGYIPKTEPILLVGHPGLGKTHIAIGLALAACQQGHKVRFYNAAGLVNEMLALRTVRVAALFREPKAGRVRVSLRSMGDFDVAEIAREFNGGGHKNAAGMSFEATLDEIAPAVVDRLKRCWESS